MLKLVIYKKNACVYLVGGTKEPIAKFDKNCNVIEIATSLNYKLARYFWDIYEDFIIKENFTKLKQHLIQLINLKN